VDLGGATVRPSHFAVARADEGSAMDTGQPNGECMSCLNSIKIELEPGVFCLLENGGAVKQQFVPFQVADVRTEEKNRTPT
jgi:hypothetical protein